MYVPLPILCPERGSCPFLGMNSHLRAHIGVRRDSRHVPSMEFVQHPGGSHSGSPSRGAGDQQPKEGYHIVPSAHHHNRTHVQDVPPYSPLEREVTKPMRKAVGVSLAALGCVPSNCASSEKDD